MYLFTIKVRHAAQPHDPDGDCRFPRPGSDAPRGTPVSVTRGSLHAVADEAMSIPERDGIARARTARDGAVPDLVRDFTPVAS